VYSERIPSLMIHQVVCAAKHMADEIGVEFAKANQLGYEVPGFVEPEILQNPEEHIQQWKTQLESINGMLTLHGPVYDLNPVSLDPRIAEVTKLRYEQAAYVCKQLGCRYLVVHSQFSTIFSVARVKQEWLSACVDFWQQFAEEVLESSPALSVVIENFMEDEPEQLRTMIDNINHPQVKACLDTGHANIFSKASVINWLDELEHQLVYIHSHNNYGQFDEHRGYNYGTVEMEGFLNHLILLPYKISLALEVFNEPELKESYQIVQRYLTSQDEHLSEKSFLI
jgi:sugar phosphate isomerase/epimerase